MAHADARQQLLDFLEKKAFQPVMRAKPEKYPENKRDKLEDVQRSTEKEIERFRGYRSADDLITNFKRDLESAPAKKVHRTLHELGLPTLPELREDFEALAEKLGH